MIPQIAGAMSRGFTSSQVVKFLLRKFPNQKDAIEKALAAGFTTDQVIRYLSRKSGQKLEEPTKTEINTDYSKMRDVDQSRIQRDEGIALKTGAAAIGAPLTLNAVGNMMQPGQQMAMQHAMPNAPTSVLGQTPQKLLPAKPPLPPSPPSPSPMNNPPAAPMQPMPLNTAPQRSSPPLQPVQPQRNVSKNVDIIKSTGQEATVKNLLEGGLSPSEIKDTLGVIIGKARLKELEKATGGIEQAIEDFATTLQKNQNDTNTPQEVVNPQQQTPQNEPNNFQNLKSGQEEIENISPLMQQKPEISSKELKEAPERIAKKKEDLSLEKYNPTGRDYTISQEYIGKWYSSKPGEFIGNLKDFFTGEELRKKFRDVLDVKVYKGSPEYRTKDGNEAYAGYGERKILLNSFNDKNIFPLLVEEASHALQDRKGRLTEDSESDYDTNVNEVSAKKHVDYLNKFYEKEKEQLDRKEKERTEERIRKALAKHDLVASPQGVGEVKEIRNGKAIVEVDGKMHKVDKGDLIQSPVSSKDLADLHDELIKGIEAHTGQEVSRNVEWAGYDPKLNELAYKPWQGGGKIYTYTDISPEDVSELQSILAQRKTSGKNYIGGWEANTNSPIGNRMHALITKLQKERGGKGNEYRTKFETIYDPTESAKKASQERYKNERKTKDTGQLSPGSSKNAPSSKQYEQKEKTEKVQVDQKELKKEDKIIENMGVDGKKVYSADVPTSEITARPDLMQFKAISESDTGENVNDLLKGKFDSLKSGVLLLWEPKNPSKYDLKGNQKYIVSNGHHRLAFAKRENVPSMLTRIIKEKDGYTARDAMRLGAEINIAEGRGTVYDQAKYFRELIGALGKDEAHLAGSGTGRPGEKAWAIAANAGDELFKSFINEDIKPEQAEAIALSTDNKDRQALGLKFARDGKSPDQIKNLLEASKMIKKRPDEQLSLFGYDDSAFKAIEDMGNAATKLQKNIRESLNAISGASRNPHKAREFGIDVKDHDAVKSARSRLNKELERWKNWSSDTDLVHQVKEYVNSH